MQPIDSSLLNDNERAALDAVSRYMANVNIPTSDGKSIRALNTRLVMYALPIENRISKFIDSVEEIVDDGGIGIQAAHETIFYIAFELFKTIHGQCNCTVVSAYTGNIIDNI